MARKYTLDPNEGDVVLQRTFNYHAIKDPLERWITYWQRFWSGKKEIITLRDVYNAFAESKTFPEIQESFENITPKTILIARAFYMASNPDEYSHRRKQYLRVLCDANVDQHQVTDGAREVFGFATHIDFIGLTDAKDSRIWAKANGRYNLILTKDRAVINSRNTMETIDLTHCVIKRWKGVLRNNGGVIDDGIRAFPVLIHVMDATLQGHEIKNLLRKHRDTIFEIYEERVSPIIQLHRDKACPGIRVHEILTDKMAEQADLERREQWIKSWKDRIYRLNPNFSKMPEEQQEHVRKTLKRAADYAMMAGEMADPLSVPVTERLAARKEVVPVPA